MKTSIKTLLLAGSALTIATGAAAQQAANPNVAQPPEQAQPGVNQAAPAGSDTPATANNQPPGAQPAAADLTLNDIIVTGNTSGKRTLFTSSSDVTLANQADIQRKAPRSTAEALELVPGIFVEGTAGGVSNNYSVRGLRGGGQTFIQLEDDGLPIIYGGGGADEYFANDIMTDRLEAVEGGTSGILAVNGAAATINFISVKPNHDHAVASARFTGTTYNDLRTDGYFSMPLTDSGLAYSAGGYVESNPGFRRSKFNYMSYNIKGVLEQKFGNGGLIRFSVRRADRHDAYYADMPFTSDGNGRIGDVPGLNGHTDNIAGKAFADIRVPDSCATGNCTRTFSLADGIHTTLNNFRLDVEAPINEHLSVFARGRYLDATFDFNGLFPGSNGQPPASAVTYLTPGTSPISSFLAQGTTRFGTTNFGLRNVLTGVVIPRGNTAVLNALNGNGLIQQTVLNHQKQSTKDFGSDFGVKFDFTSGILDNSLTVGGMYYNVRRYSDQSATATLLNDVTNNSNIYDVVALNGANQVIGQLSNNGMISYGNWGQGIFHDKVESISGYFNDELKIGDDLHIDFGLRYEHQQVGVDIGNTATTNGPVPAGTPGIITDLGSTFTGTFTHQDALYQHLAGTVGVNYTFTRNLAVYARYAHGFQTNGGDTGGTHAPSDLTLYEAGVRYQTRGIVASVVGFRTEFRDQSFSFQDPANPANQTNALADDNINGVQLDADIKPVDWFSLSVSGVYQEPKLQNLRFNGTAQPQYNNNTPERTPKKLLTVTPAFVLPGGLGEIYGRYKYVGKIFADAGDGVSLPAYGVFTVGASLNVARNINVNVSVDNLTDVSGYTEGNPRQGQTQSIVNGYFYGRSIIGRNALASITFKF